MSAGVLLLLNCCLDKGVKVNKVDFIEANSFAF